MVAKFAVHVRPDWSLRLEGPVSYTLKQLGRWNAPRRLLKQRGRWNAPRRLLHQPAIGSQFRLDGD